MLKKSLIPFVILNLVAAQNTMAQPSQTGAPAAATGSSSLHWWPPSERAYSQGVETILEAVPNAASLHSFQDSFASEPHLAGTPGDERSIKRLAMIMRMLGLEVTVHEFWAYLAKPVDASVQIVSPEQITLPVKEEPVAKDPLTKDPSLTIGFNAYSGNGDVTAEVVYANYGTRADFNKLKELGIDCTGKVVIARYGGNFRGYKAKFAQEAGAAGLIIYTDPADSGFGKGPVYPEGGWANESYIQRGAISTLDYPGDPLTPSIAATEDAQRLDPEKVDLPKIPVQPIGYGAAKQILSRMHGRELPQDLHEKWKGGLECDYRLEGGPDLRVRLMVKQERAITKSANVVGVLWGAERPGEKIVIGCHHDAWCDGASDPVSGLILMFECARSFSDAVAKGHPPARSIVFAAWGAEEYGMIGSTEYCEQYDSLLTDAVAYINLDAAAMGPNFDSSASPSLKRIIEEVTQDVPQARNSDHKTVHQLWLGDRDEATFGNLGGGSDHVAFYCHLGIPSCSVGGGGAPGTAYHSNYDTPKWYRQVVGDDYEPALMLTRVVNLLAWRLSSATLLPLDPVRYATDFKSQLDQLEKRALKLKFPVDFSGLRAKAQKYQDISEPVLHAVQQAIEAGPLPDDSINQINFLLLNAERDWLKPEPQPDSPKSDSLLAQRPWFRNLYAATDPDSGYAAWVLPALRTAIEHKDSAALKEAEDQYRGVFERLTARMEAINKAFQEGKQPTSP